MNKNSNVVNISNSSKIVFFSDSFNVGVYNLPGKATINNLSAFSDWNFENYSKSGDDYTEILARILSNTAGWHSSFPIKEYNGTYALLQSYANDQGYISGNLETYIANLRKVIIAVKGLGMIPIICDTYYSGGNSDLLSTSLSAVAKEYDCMFIDVLEKAKFLRGSDNARLWLSGHAGTRTNHLIFQNMLSAINSLPRPKQGIKIYRKRAEFSISGVNDLFYQNTFGRAKAFKEIYCSHGCFSSGDEKYYDNLDQYPNTGSATKVEYFKIRAGETVAFSDYTLIEAILPTIAKNVTLARLKLTLSATPTNVYVKDTASNTFTAATYSSGVIQITDLKRYMEYDKITFLLDGTFNMTGISLEWFGENIPKIETALKSNISKELGTTELLATNLVTTLTGWTVTGSLTPADTADNNYPTGVTKVVSLTTSNYLTQNFTFTSDPLRKRKLQIKTWARYAPALFSYLDTYPDNSAVTEDTFDYAQLEVRLKKDSSNIAYMTDWVGLHWKECIFEVDVPAGESSIDVIIKSNDKTIEFARASVKIEN